MAGHSRLVAKVEIMNQVAPIAASINLPALIVAAGDQAARRFLEFFATTRRNPHTRRAYVGDDAVVMAARPARCAGA